MSTNITFAWKYEGQRITDLVKLGKKVREIEDTAYDAETVDTVVSYPWMSKAAKSLHEVGEDIFSKFAEVASYPIRQMIACLNEEGGCTMVDEQSEYLNLLLINRLDHAGISLSVTQSLELVSLCRDLAEKLAQATPTLVFIQGKGNFTYIKSFGISAAAIRYLDSICPRFEYTDATDMQPDAFDSSVQELCRSVSDTARANILRTAQEERGQDWADALGDDGYEQAGLSYRVVEMSNARMQRILLSILDKAYAKPPAL